jgi:hypothetical protein
MNNPETYDPNKIFNVRELFTKQTKFILLLLQSRGQEYVQHPEEDGKVVVTKNNEVQYWYSVQGPSKDSFWIDSEWEVEPKLSLLWNIDPETSATSMNIANVN